MFSSYSTSPLAVLLISIFSALVVNTRRSRHSWLLPILGRHYTSSTTPAIPIASIASFTANKNKVVAYQQFCRDLTQIGVTEDMIEQNGNKIFHALKSQEIVGTYIRDRGQ